jgi:hypothetical protein
MKPQGVVCKISILSIPTVGWDRTAGKLPQKYEDRGDDEKNKKNRGLCCPWFVIPLA